MTVRFARSSAAATVAILLSACPAVAAEPEAALPVANALYLGGAALLVLMGFLLLRQTRRLAETEGAARRLASARAVEAALAESAPAGWLRLDTAPAGLVLPQVSPPLARLLALDDHGGLGEDDVLDRLALEDADRLREAIVALRRDGTAFRLTVTDAAGAKAFDATGSGGAVWFAEVTAWREREREARARADLVESLTALLPFPVWRRNAALDATYINPTAEALLPRLGEDRGLALRAQRHEATQMESHYVVVDGARRLFEFCEMPLPGGAGTAGWANDVTALEQMQDELSRHVEVHESMLERLNTAIAVFGPDKRLKFHNRAFAKLWQLEDGQIANNPTLVELMELLREQRKLPEQADFRAFRERWQRMFTTLIEPREELIFLPDDTTYRMYATPHPLGGLLLVFEDVTDRLALERSYNTLNEVQRETIDRLYDGIAVFGSDGRLKLDNAVFVRMWNLPEGIEADEPHISAVLEAMRALFPENGDWAGQKRAFINQAANRDGETVRLERADGTVHDCTFVPLPDGATLVNFRDVTDTLRVQRALQDRNEALETADRLKSEFIANVSYELRTPLNAIIGFSELLAGQYIGPMNAKQLDYAHSITESSQRLATLINDILDLASIEAGYLRLEVGTVDMRSLLASVVSLSREHARTRDIALELAMEDGVDVIHADDRRLKQALFNVLSNAIKFAPRSAHILVDAHVEAHGLTIRVTDQGGSAGSQREIYETFLRGDGVRRRSEAGLGLSLAQRLIEMHGGRIDIVDVEDGSEVRCRIPFEAPAQPDAMVE
jgi:signal transduction histidine kinase